MTGLQTVYLAKLLVFSRDYTDCDPKCNIGATMCVSDENELPTLRHAESQTRLPRAWP